MTFFRLSAWRCDLLSLISTQTNRKQVFSNIVFFYFIIEFLLIGTYIYINTHLVTKSQDLYIFSIFNLLPVPVFTWSYIFNNLWWPQFRLFNLFIFLHLINLDMSSVHVHALNCRFLNKCYTLRVFLCINMSQTRQPHFAPKWPYSCQLLISNVTVASIFNTT